MNNPSNPFNETICGTCEPEDELDAAIHTPLPVDDDDDEVTCAICLSSPPEEERRRLEGCTHQFCTLCLSKLVVHALTPINKSPTLGNAAVAACMKACRCPSCATRLSEAEIDRCLVDARGTVPCRLPALRSALRRARRLPTAITTPPTSRRGRRRPRTHRRRGRSRRGLGGST